MFEQTFNNFDDVNPYCSILFVKKTWIHNPEERDVYMKIYDIAGKIKTAKNQLQRQADPQGNTIGSDGPDSQNLQL